MYEALEAHMKDFNDIRAVFDAPDSAARVTQLRAALDATAERISSVNTDSDFDRSNLAKLYRGFVATSRVLGKLQETRNA